MKGFKTIIEIEHEDCYGKYTVKLEEQNAIQHLKEKGILTEKDRILKVNGKKFKD